MKLLKALLVRRHLHSSSLRRRDCVRHNLLCKARVFGSLGQAIGLYTHTHRVQLLRPDNVSGIPNSPAAVLSFGHLRWASSWRSNAQQQPALQHGALIYSDSTQRRPVMPPLRRLYVRDLDLIRALAWGRLIAHALLAHQTACCSMCCCFRFALATAMCTVLF